MSKNFSAAPKPKSPTAEAIVAFEQGGSGHDGKPTNVGKIKTTNVDDEPAKRLSIDLPASVHTRFKTACSATNTKMVTELLEFIEKRTTELEEKAGIRR